jgi:hypothetical protein
MSDGTVVFDPLSNSRFLWQMARHAALCLAVYIAVDIVIFIFCVIVGFLGLGLSRAYQLWAVLGFLVWLGFLLMYWLQPVPALLDQNGRLLTNSAARWMDVLDRVSAVLVRQETPSDSLRRRSLSPPGEGRREYLEWQRGVFTAMVSSFSSGQDLYVGWTYWIHMSPARLAFMYIGRRFQGLTGRGNDMYQTLRYDSVRAAIAAIDVAVGEVTRDLAGPQSSAGGPGAGDPGGAAAGPHVPDSAPEAPGQLRERVRAGGGDQHAQG